MAGKRLKIRREALTHKKPDVEAGLGSTSGTDGKASLGRRFVEVMTDAAHSSRAMADALRGLSTLAPSGGSVSSSSFTPRGASTLVDAEDDRFAPRLSRSSEYSVVPLAYVRDNSVVETHRGPHFQFDISMRYDVASRIYLIGLRARSDGVSVWYGEEAMPEEVFRDFGGNVMCNAVSGRVSSLLGRFVDQRILPSLLDSLAATVPRSIGR